MKIWKRRSDATLVRIDMVCGDLVYYRMLPGPALPVFVDGLDALARVDIDPRFSRAGCWSVRTFETLYDDVSDGDDR